MMPKLDFTKDAAARKPWWIDRNRYMRVLVIGSVILACVLVANALHTRYLRGHWEVTQTVDPISDSVRTSAAINTDDIRYASPFVSGGEASFSVTCERGVVNIRFGAGNQQDADFIFRFDRHPPITLAFLGSSSPQLKGEDIPSAEEPELARLARTSKRLVVRTFDHRNYSTDIYFNLRGNDIAFKEFDKGCRNGQG